MAYVIGSQKGKDIAKNMKAGETYKASDGSTWTKKSDGSVSVTHNGQTYNNAYPSPSSGGSSSSSKGYSSSSNKNSQYTGSSTGVKTYNSTQQSIKDQMNANSIAWWSADDTEKKRLEAENQRLSQLLGGSVSYNAKTGTWSGEADGNDVLTKDDILNYLEEYEQNNQRPSAPESDPRIDAMLNEILNRDGFSYDAMNDPLYQQYAEMYRREGDRAMKEAMAEAAASAGGMNTYAMTAAQQANSYYNSKLNDVIPELYGVAYDKYLKDIDLKIQDLGLLQAMDDKQYNRYRDTMTDWSNDRNFAYGNYLDAVQQGNWQANFDNNNYWANKEFNFNEAWKNKEFDYNDYWKNKEWDYNDSWKNKEWDESESDEAYERSEAEKEEAKSTIAWYIENGVSADAIPKDLIAKSGLDQNAISQMITYFKQQQASKGTSSSGGSSGGSGYTGGSSGSGTGGNGNGYTGSGAQPVGSSANYNIVASDCEKLASSGDKWAATAYAKEAFDKKLITQDEYNSLVAKYNPMLDVTLGTFSPQNVFGLK